VSGDDLGLDVDLAIAEATFGDWVQRALHGEDDALFDAIEAADRDVLEGAMVVALEMLTSRDNLLGYARQLGWVP
jgi:hypothetical protein